MSVRGASRRRKPLAFAVLFAVLAIGLIPGAAEAKKKKKHKFTRSGEVTLMTRNLYLGSDLSPALASATPQQFADANGQILNNVDASNFPARAVSLAAEIKSKNADLVGLQEAALWRTQTPPDSFSGRDTPATQVRYDFIASLLGELNKGADPQGCAKIQRKAEKKGKTPAPCNSGYSLLYAQPEFDFEGPANTDANTGTGVTLAGGAIMGADIDGRLTMRDAILVKNDPGIRTSAAFGGKFNSLLRVTVGGAVQINVTRGYVQADVNVRGNKFRLVNAHLEAFDSQATGNPVSTGGTVNRGEIRQAQAKQLLASPLQSPKLPSILIGDLNSNVPGVQSGDSLAFQAILDGGFLSRTSTPTSCCYDDIANPNSPGLDHQVDQIVVNKPAIARKSSSFTTTFASGLWSSDHAGVASTLEFPHKKHKKKKHKK
jgi:hypothetical protein